MQTARKNKKMKRKNFIYSLHFITRKVDEFLNCYLQQVRSLGDL